MIKGRFILFAALLALIAIPGAYATAELDLVSGLSHVHVVDNQIGDLNPMDNVILFSGPVGTWNLNVTTGASHGALAGSDMDLNSINNTTAASTLTIMFSDDGFVSGFPEQFMVNGNKTGAAATLTFQAFEGAAKFALTDQIGTDLVFNLAAGQKGYGGATSGTGFGGALTEVAILTFAGVGGTSFDASLAPVPEPTTLALLGGGLLLTGIAIRRRRS